jgi:hypothetical protein
MSYFAVYSMLIQTESCCNEIHSSQALDNSYVGGKGVQPQTASTGSFGVYFSVQLPTVPTVNLQLNRSTPISLSPIAAAAITMKRTNPSYPFNHAIRPK